MSTCPICKNKQSNFFHKIGEYIYHLCPRCRTIFLNPIPTYREINGYYKNNFKYTAGETNEKEIRLRAKIILKNLIKMNPRGKTLLDIGSGYGYFLDEASKKGLKVIGIEPSSQLRAVLINQLINTVIHNDFNNFFKINQNKKFDFITLIHTIEHVINPQETITNAIKLLKPGGILFIETPNLKSHLFNSEKYNYTFLTPPDHIWIFSNKSFHYMLQTNSNIQVERISSYSYPEHFMGIIKSLFQEVIESNNDSGCAPTCLAGRQELTAYQNDKNKLKKIKYLLFDNLLAPILTPLLNIGIYGSILELYIRKK